MSRSTKLLMTTAFVASFSVMGQAHAVTISADGNIGSQAPVQATAGTSGAAATAGTAGTPAVTYSGAGIDGIANANISGQQGGNGGNDTDGGANGGAGGAGAEAVLFATQTTPTLTVNTGIVVTGGAGGTGGNVTAGVGDGGAGGAGAAGVTANSAGSIITLNGTGSIVGGAGGAGGTGFGGGVSGAAGAGGDGITVTDVTTILFGGAGSISGGAAGAGGTAQGSGISVEGSNKTLTINSTNGTGTVSGGNSGAGIALEVVSGAVGNTITNAATIGGAAHTGAGISLDANTASVSNSGTVQSSTGNGVSVLTGRTLTGLTNTGTITSATGAAVNVAGTITTITNSVAGTQGIRATGSTGVAVNVAAGGNLDTVTNTGGLITSANTSTTTSGTVVLGADVAGVTLTGGTISNTTTGNVLTINADQTGTIASSSTLSSNGGNAIRFQGTSGSFTNTGTVTGNISSSAVSKVQTITNSTGGTITGDITLDDGDDVVNLNGGTITGAISLGAANDTFTYANAASATGLVGTIDFGSGTNILNVNESMTTGGAITTTVGNTTAATVATGKTFTVAHDVDLADGTFTNNGTVTINAGKSVAADADIVSGTGKYIFQVANATAANGTGGSNGLLNLSGGVAQSGIDSASDLQVDVASAAALSDGANIRIVRGGAAETTDFTGTAVTDNSYLFNFLVRNGNDTGVTFTGATVNDIVLEVDRVGATSTTSATAKTIDPVLANIGTSGDATFDVIQNRVAAATSEAGYNAILEALGPQINNAAPQATAQTVGLVTDLVTGRLTSNRDASSGSETLENRMWVQGLGNTAEQGTRNGVKGYDTDTYGVAVGVDGIVLDGVFPGATTAGMALSYANTSVNSKDINSTDSDIDGYQLTLYGDQDFGEGTFIEGVATYGWNSVDSNRHDVGGISGLQANAQFDAKTYGLHGGLGHSFGFANTASLTPKAYAEYLVYDADTYTETGAGSANLTVDTTATKQMNLGLALELANKYTMADGALLKPRATIGYKHDVKGDSVSQNATFAAGGGAFVANGTEIDSDTLSAGIGLDYYSAGSFQLTMDYDYDSKDAYDSHTGIARASHRF